MIKDRSHTISHAMWAYHLYPVAAGASPAVQVVMNKKKKSFILLQFMLVETKISVINK